VLSWTGRTFIPQRRSRRSVQQGHPTWGTDYVTIGAVESFRQWNNRVYAEPKGIVLGCRCALAVICAPGHAHFCFFRFTRVTSPAEEDASVETSSGNRRDGGVQRAEALRERPRRYRFRRRRRRERYPFRIPHIRVRQTLVDPLPPLHFFSFAWRRAGSSRLPCHLTPPKLVPDLQIQAIDARCGIVNDLAARLLLEATERSVDKLLRERPAGGLKRGIR
jgi:hypothetical protein